MRFTGTLKSWNDERGFGFIEPAQGGQELFVHIKAFPPGTGRPAVGQILHFEVGTSANGKKNARAVQYPKRTKSISRRKLEQSAAWTVPRVLALPAFAVMYTLVVWRCGFSLPIFSAYLALSVVTFLVYAFDKSAATSGRRRIAEQTLHLFAMLGGWPGALVAQQILRHKTSKQEFVQVFWFTVAVNVGVFAAWHAGLLAKVMPT